MAPRSRMNGLRRIRFPSSYRKPPAIEGAYTTNATAAATRGAGAATRGARRAGSGRRTRAGAAARFGGALAASALSLAGSRHAGRRISSYTRSVAAAAAVPGEVVPGERAATGRASCLGEPRVREPQRPRPRPARAASSGGTTHPPARAYHSPQPCPPATTAGVPGERRLEGYQAEGLAHGRMDERRRRRRRRRPAPRPRARRERVTRSREGRERAAGSEGRTGPRGASSASGSAASSDGRSCPRFCGRSRAHEEESRPRPRRAHRGRRAAGLDAVGDDAGRVAAGRGPRSR